MKTRSNTKTYFTYVSGGPAPTTDLGFTTNMQNLHSLISGINDEDGNRKVISEVQFIMRAYVADSAIFGLQPVIVQTAGNWSNTINLAQRTFDTALAASIDDVFGYDRLGGMRFSKAKPTGDGTLATLIQSIESNVTLPAKFIQILNKEVESERLQDLFFGFVGLSLNTGLTIYIYLQIVVQFIEQRQKVVIR